MSGHKRATITISQEEYDRLRDAEVHLKAMPAPQVEVIHQIHQESQDGLRANLDWVTQRQEHFSRVLAGFDEHLREVETMTSQTILAHQARMEQMFAQREGMLWDAALEMIDQAAQYFEAQIAAEHRRNQERLSSFERRLGRMAGDLQRKVEIASRWLASAEQLGDFIRQNYNYSFFLPGQVERLTQQLELARENLELGMPEAVLVTAQQVYGAFSQMRLELEHLEAEWQMLYCAVWEAACNLHALVEANREVEAVDLDGNRLDVQLDVDYWTGGGLKEIYAGLDEIFGWYEPEGPKPGSAELRSLLAERIPALRAAWEETVLNARIGALNSQMRINIADLVVQALQEQGFWLEEWGYENVDERQSYKARLASREGGEVEVVVAPRGEDLGENELHLKSFDAQRRTEHELLQRWREINRSLTRRGLAVQQAEIVGGDPVTGNSRRAVRRSTAHTLQRAAGNGL